MTQTNSERAQSPSAPTEPSEQTSQQPDSSSPLALLRLFRRCAHLQRPADRTGQNRILMCLLERGDMTQRRLAEVTQRSPATLCQQLEAMEQAGLVSRKPSETDRRNVDVRLTDQGHRAAQEAIESRQRRANELFGCLPEADRAELARILGTLERTWREGVAAADQGGRGAAGAQGSTGRTGAPADGKGDVALPRSPR